MEASLDFREGPRAGQTIELPVGEEVVVGQHWGATVAIPEDTALADLHFAVLWDGKECRVRDLFSGFGTAVNAKPVEEAILMDGDEITAGLTVCKVWIEGQEQAPATMKQGRWATSAYPLAPATGEMAIPGGGRVEVSLHDKVLRLLMRQHEPLFALVDAARDPLAVLTWLKQCGEENQSLYEGVKGERLAAAAPYLVQLSPQSSCLESLVGQGWGNHWGVYLTCLLPFKEVRKHFRHFLLVELPGRKEVYFRFYDPRVLRVFLPTCSPEEANRFFGPIGCFLTEGEKAGALLTFTRESKGIKQTSFRVKDPE